MVVSMLQATPDPDRVFGALADATRRDIVRRAITGEEGVAELALHYPISFAAVQKHVAMLERAGLVSEAPHRPAQGRPNAAQRCARGATPARSVRGAVERPL